MLFHSIARVLFSDEPIIPTEYPGERACAVLTPCDAERDERDAACAEEGFQMARFEMGFAAP